MDELNSFTFHHREHLDWLNELNFYQDQIKILQNDLLAVLHKKADSLSIIEHLEEYRMILLKKLEIIDILRHQIILQEKILSTDLKLSSDLLWDHRELRMKVKEFEKDFDTMKQNLRRFAAYND